MPSVVAAKPVDVADAKVNAAMTTIKMTPEQRFEATDFTDKDSITLLFPPYVQEQHAMRKARAKNISNAVNIEVFNMKTPYGDRFLLQNTKLVLEANKRQALIGANGESSFANFKFLSCLTCTLHTLHVLSVDEASAFHRLDMY